MAEKMDLMSAASKEGLTDTMKAVTLAYNLVVKTEIC